MIPSNTVIPIHCDSQSAIALVTDDAAQIPAKHIDIRLRYLQEKILRNAIRVTYIPSADNLADILTKALPVDSFSRIVNKITVEFPSV